MKKLIAIMISSIIFFTFTVPAFAESDTLSGDGTESSPYRIETAEDYVYFAENYEMFEDAFISLENDITVIPADTEPVLIGSGDAPFIGNFDGKNNTITFEESFAGMFGCVTASTIKNLTVNGDLTCGEEFAGGIVCKSVNNTEITNCVFEGSITDIETDNIGGICGYAEDGITVKQCVNRAEINCDVSCVGGIIGYATGGTVIAEDCTNYGNITGYGNISGIIGEIVNAGFRVDHCVNAGEITADRYAGGILGFNNNDTCNKEICVLNCQNRGNITMTNKTRGYCAGIISLSSSEAAGFTIYNCINTGKITGLVRNGGIVAYWVNSLNQKITMYNCYNGGEISGNNKGAIIGYYDRREKLDNIHDVYYDSAMCDITDSMQCLKNIATPLSGKNVNSDAVTKLNGFISKDKTANTGLLTFAVGYVNENGEVFKYNNSETVAQVVFENDILQSGMNGGSVLSQGNLWLLIGISVIAVGCIIALVVLKKKRAKVSDQ